MAGAEEHIPRHGGIRGEVEPHVQAAVAGCAAHTATGASAGPGGPRRRCHRGRPPASRRILGLGGLALREKVEPLLAERAAEQRGVGLHSVHGKGEAQNRLHAWGERRGGARQTSGIGTAQATIAARTASWRQWRTHASSSRLHEPGTSRAPGAAWRRVPTAAAWLSSGCPAWGGRRQAASTRRRATEQRPRQQQRCLRLVPRP